jgi:hypothetical protein
MGFVFPNGGQRKIRGIFFSLTAAYGSRKEVQGVQGYAHKVV